MNRLSLDKETMTDEEDQIIEQYTSTTSLLWLYDDTVTPIQYGRNLKNIRKVIAHPLPGAAVSKSKNERQRLGLHFVENSDALKMCEHLMKFRRSPNILIPAELSSKCPTGERVISLNMANMTLRVYLQKNKKKIFFSENPILGFSPFFINLMTGIGKGTDVVHSEGFSIGDLSLDSVFVYHDRKIDKEVIPMILVTKIHPNTDANVALDLKAICTMLNFAIRIGTSISLPHGHEILDLKEKMKNNILKSAKSILIHPGLWAPLQKSNYLLEFLNWYEYNDNVKKGVYQYVGSHLVQSKEERDEKRRVEGYMQELKDIIHHINRRYRDYTDIKSLASTYTSTQTYLNNCPGLLMKLVEYGKVLKLQHMVHKVQANQERS